MSFKAGDRVKRISDPTRLNDQIRIGDTAVLNLFDGFIWSVVNDRNGEPQVWNPNYFALIEYPHEIQAGEIREGMELRSPDGRWLRVLNVTVGRRHHEDRVKILVDDGHIDPAVWHDDSPEHPYFVRFSKVEPEGEDQQTSTFRWSYPIEPLPEKTLREKRAEIIATFDDKTSGMSLTEVLDCLERADHEHFDSKRSEIKYALECIAARYNVFDADLEVEFLETLFLEASHE